MTLLIYDCDGVLVDSEVLACGVLADVMSSLGQPMTADACVRIFGGRSVADVLARAEQILGRPVPRELGEQAAQQLARVCVPLTTLSHFHFSRQMSE